MRDQPEHQKKWDAGTVAGRWTNSAVVPASAASDEESCRNSGLWQRLVRRDRDIEPIHELIAPNPGAGAALAFVKHNRAKSPQVFSART